MVINMNKLLIVIDMQNDFITGSLGSKQAQAIVGNVTERVRRAQEKGWDIVFTRDTHTIEYLNTQEGKKLPIEHCIQNTEGWQIIPELAPFVGKVFNKPAFGSLELVDCVKKQHYDEIELIGVCTDICVVSNALLLKANLLNTEIRVIKDCCAGVTPESHEAALLTMQMCQITIDESETMAEDKLSIA